MIRLRTVALFASAIGAVAAASLIQSTPQSAAQKHNPFDGDESARRAGAKLYVRECASCHGDNREGRRNAPPLNRKDVQSAPSGTLFWILRNGSPHRAMPSFAHLPDAQRWQIVTFLRNSAPQ